MRSLVFRTVIISMAMIGAVMLFGPAWTSFRAADFSGLSGYDVLWISCSIGFWIIVIRWTIKRRNRGHSVPVPIVASYFWYQIEAPLTWLAFLWSKKRVARFLSRADDLRVRQKRVEQVIPSLTSCGSSLGDSDIPTDC